MAIHERVLYIGMTPGQDRQFISGTVECPFESTEDRDGPPVDFDAALFDLFVFHPDRRLTREEALVRVQELISGGSVHEGHFGVLTGPCGLAVSVRAREVRVQGVLVALTLREFDLLRLLLEHRGEVLTADDIARSIWGYETYGSRNFVESHISRLRFKLARAGGSGAITTVRGVGYMVLDEVGVAVSD